MIEGVRCAPGWFGGVPYRDDEWQTVTTLLPCGLEVVAVPQDRDEPLAHELGYPDVWALTLDHDPAHVALARFLGLSSSPALERLAHRDGTLASDSLVALEEAAVQAVLAYGVAASREGWRRARCPGATPPATGAE